MIALQRPSDEGNPFGWSAEDDDERRYRFIEGARQIMLHGDPVKPHKVIQGYHDDAVALRRTRASIRRDNLRALRSQVYREDPLPIARLLEEIPW